MKGAELRKRREALGLTQQRLADRLGVARNTIARWERQERAIPTYLDLALKSIEREKPRQRKQ
jgi:transcriptional regulator with XRE-family HTH domain